MFSPKKRPSGGDAKRVTAKASPREVLISEERRDRRGGGGGLLFLEVCGGDGCGGGSAGVKGKVRTSHGKAYRLRNVWEKRGTRVGDGSLSKKKRD